MKRDAHMKTKPVTRSLAVITLLSLAAQANAVTVSLCAGVTSKSLPDGTNVTMWGYGLEDGSANCASATVPGPALEVPIGDNALTINLRNTLPEPASIIVPGLASATPPAPVFFTDGQNRARARSFTNETATGATGSYSFNAAPGTYLYHSGSHAAVQVQMGLYGSVKKDAATGEAYAGVAYDKEVLLVYSEIDTALHAAVAGGVYGTPAYPSTIGYKPNYFLVNGQPYTSTTADIPAGTVGERTLIRFVNAGLETHVPTFVGQRVDIIAEHGHAYPYVRDQYSVMLVAGQTRDAIMSPITAGTYTVFDRRLRLVNDSNTTGGLLSHLLVSAVGGGVTPPVAVSDTEPAAIEDAPIVTNVVVNDTSAAGLDLATLTISTQAVNGVATANSDGTVTYVPHANFNGTDSYTYTIRDIGGLLSNPATVTVTVAAVNDAPVAMAESLAATTGLVLSGNVLGNDFDIDGDSLTAVLQTTTSNGTLLLNSDGSFDYTPAGAGADSFTYAAFDGTVNSNIVTVNITITAPVNQAPVAVDDYTVLSVGGGTAAERTTVISVLNNDSDADGTLNPATVTIVTQPRYGQILSVNTTTGAVTYRLRTKFRGFRGSDTFSYTVRDNLGEISNRATVRVDIVN